LRDDGNPEFPESARDGVPFPGYTSAKIPGGPRLHFRECFDGSRRLSSPSRMGSPVARRVLRFDRAVAWLPLDHDSGIAAMSADEQIPEDDIPEVEIRIEPDDEKLAGLGVTPEEFDAQLEIAIDDYHDLLETCDDEEEAPGIEDIQIELQGQVYRLADLATISIVGDLESLEEFDDEDDEE
jgi:hypothetical protein